MKPLGGKLTSWNRYFIVNARDLFVETSLRKFTLLSFKQNCAYYPGAKPGKKHTLNKQYALLSQLRLLTRVYGIVCIQVPTCVLRVKVYMAARACFSVHIYKL